MIEFLHSDYYDYILKKPGLTRKKMPVIVFLHGAGTRGTSLEVLATNPFFGENSWYGKEDCNALIYAPLCMDNSWFDRFEQLQSFVKFALSHPDADPERLYLIGTSMGGYGVWQLAMSMSEYVAALFPVCGGGMTWNFQPLLHIPVWTVHGLADKTVDPKDSIAFVEKINNHGGEAHISLLEGVPHASWNQAFADKEIYEWLFSKKRSNRNGVGINEYAGSKQFG